jgi:hypothetical protein
MPRSRETTELLEALAKVLLRCTVFGFLLVLIWFGVYLLAPDLIRAQGEWFLLSSHDLGVLHYCGIVFVKCCVLLFFLIPYISIRLVLRKAANKS